ncbi:gastrula zinc finger protein XlCGF26.1-like isoform X10 [Colias croceus]|uniref:gastrula zinc finger protein XlCGF26.1-like isoform X10 n=1 Tax=Colias crocea TaxID=72248 RepID=UPI001E280990|nr:gastrula zinc finger protein XlCGF26.1-like isoform X10 [Colias croceus]
MDGKSNEWRPGPTVCRCCLSEGCYKDISTEYFWMGKREVYAEMLSETFDLTVSYARSGTPNSHSRLICEPCISRLRDAADFKRQVKECEQTFLQCFNPASAVDIEIPMDITDKDSVKVEKVKQEKENSYDDDDFADAPEFLDDDDDLDDQPLMNLATKVPKKESVDVMDLLDNAKAVKRKASKTKSSPAKRKVKEVKPSASKTKPERKKKEVDWLVGARLNAKVVLKYSTAYPFRIPNNSMVCVYCCDSYDDPQAYRDHMNTEHAQFNVKTAFAHVGNNYTEYLKVDCTELKCRICTVQLDTLEEISKHLLVAHGKDINTDVEIGMQMFKLGQERWVCALCSVKVPCLRELSRHTSSHYHKYTCETCGKSYINRENLQRHAQYGHSDAKVCMKCKQVFQNTEARRQHILSSEKCWPMSCAFCGMRFLTRKAKFAHCAEVHGQGPKEYKCPECSMVFNKWTPYRAHFVLSHTNNIFTCSFCGLQFDNKRALDEHVVSHTKEKAFTCTVCSKSFARKKNLIQHSWVHSEYKRFECKMCNKQFNQRVSWKTHMKSYHPELVDF